MDAYLAEVRIEGADKALFPTLDKTHRMSGSPLTRRDILRIVKERCLAGGIVGDLLQSQLPGKRHHGLPAKRRRSKLLRTWPITPTRARLSYTIGGRIWRRSAKSSVGPHLSERNHEGRLRCITRHASKADSALVQNSCRRTSLRVADHPPQNSAPNHNRSDTLSGAGGWHRKALRNRDKAPRSCYSWVTLHEQ